jgi:hypothetical protein
MMFRSIMTMRWNRRAGSGAGISNSLARLFSHWARLGFIVIKNAKLKIKNAPAFDADFAFLIFNF